MNKLEATEATPLANSLCRSLCELLSLTEFPMEPIRLWDTIVISSFIFDLEWFTQTFLGSFQQTLLPPRHIILLADAKRFSHTQNIAQLLSLKKGIESVSVILPSALGCYHSKFILAFTPLNESQKSTTTEMDRKTAGLRFILTTANMTEVNMSHCNELFYCQDFPLKEKGEENVQQSDFEHVLCSYLEHAKRRAETFVMPSTCNQNLIEKLHRIDFTEAHGKLVCSVSGKPITNTNKGKNLFGLSALSDAIKSLSIKDEEECVIEQRWQYTSQSSASSCLVQSEFAKALAGNDGLKNNKEAHLKIIYPTEDDIRGSLRGWASGLHIPIRMSSFGPNINKHLHKWSTPNRNTKNETLLSKRQRTMPHLKTYARVIRRRKGDEAMGENVSLDTLLVTSANMSTSAWGRRGSHTNETNTQRNFEMGLLFHTLLVPKRSSSSATVYSCTPWNPVNAPLGSVRVQQREMDKLATVSGVFIAPFVDSFVIALPYNILHPQPYDADVSSGLDIPWAIDFPHNNKLDSLGKTFDEAMRNEYEEEV